MSDSGDSQQERHSVFGATDQDAMISKIEAVSEDDLSSSFFENSIQDVEDAAVRMFDIGIRTLTDDSNVPMAAFGARPSELPAAVVDQAVAPGAEGRFEDPAQRAAFILGGPAGLDR